MDLTLKPGRSSKIPTKELTLEPKYDAPSDPYTTTREYYVGHIALGDIARHLKGLYGPQFSTLEERTKDTPWGDILKI